MFRSRFGLALVLGLCGLMSAANAQAPGGGNPRVKITTSKGDIVVELNQQQSPVTVENFLRYVGDGFYDDTIFHRVIPGFMIQGGGMTEKLMKKPTKAPIANEASNGLKNDKYTIAMARTGDPNSATSQFFINTVDNAGLNRPSPDGHGYAVFGKVISGTEVVDAIEKVATGTAMSPVGAPMADVPKEPVFIRSIQLITNAGDADQGNVGQPGAGQPGAGN